MTRPVSFARAEPAVFIGLLQALAQAAVGVFTVFVAELDADQIGAIHAFLAAFLAVAGAVWTRGQVTSVASLDALAVVPPLPPVVASPAPRPLPKARKAAKKR